MIEFFKDQEVTINGQPWVVTEYEAGSSCVWARRATGVMPVAHKVVDVTATETGAAEPVGDIAADIKHVQAEANRILRKGHK